MTYSENRNGQQVTATANKQPETAYCIFFFFSAVMMITKADVKEINPIVL